MIRTLALIWWSICLEAHELAKDFYARRGSPRWWKHNERIRRCQSRIIGLRT